MLQQILGFDFGQKKIGIALGQTLTKQARPLITLPYHRQQPDWQAITKLVQEWQPTDFVVGLPYNMDGSEQLISQLARQFAEQLKQRYHLPIHLVDERLTTREAWQRHTQHRPKAKLPKRDRLDAIAATLIIETWFRENP